MLWPPLRRRDSQEGHACFFAGWSKDHLHSVDLGGNYTMNLGGDAEPLRLRADRWITWFEETNGGK